MGLIVHLHFLSTRENLVPPVLLVPLGKRGRHVHLLNDVPPAHARVVRAERNLAFLRGIRNNALLGPPEVVVEQILKPHPCDEQEVPPVLPTLHHILNAPVRTDLPVILSRSIKVLVKLPQQIHQLEMRRRLKRIVILHQTQRHSHYRQKFPARRIIHLRNILSQLIPRQERSHRHCFLSFLINHYRHASPAIRVTTTRELTPVVFYVVGVHEVCPIAECSHERNWEPVAAGFAQAGLIFYVVG